jgi:hypothetical protein
VRLKEEDCILRVLTHHWKPFEYIGYLMQHTGNMVENTKIPPKKSQNPTTPQKEEELGPCGCMLSPLTGCVKILFLKLFIAIFGFS